MFTRRALSCSLFLLVMALTPAGCSSNDTQNGGQGIVPKSVPTMVVTEKETVAETFKTKAAPHVIVDTFSGRIRVTVGADDAVKSEVTKICVGATKEEARDALKVIEVKQTQEGDTVRITARRTDLTEGKNVPPQKFAEAMVRMALPRSADVEVKVPAGAKLELRTAFGNIDATGIAGNIDAKTSSGAVVISGGKGSLQLSSGFGGLTVDGHNTAVTADTRSGAVTVKGARGPLQLTSGFGNIEVKDATEKTTARTQSGAVSVRGCKGPLEAHTDFGGITLEDVQASTTAETKSGTITVKGATDGLKLKSGFGNIEVNQAPAGATAETSSGAVTIKRGKGDVKAKSGFGQVSVEGTAVLVQARTESGAVQFHGSLADGDHELSSGFGNLTVTLPADSRFHVEARTGFGKVANEFTLTPEGKSSDTELRGTVGDSPAAKLKLTTKSGSVQIRKGTR